MKKVMLRYISLGLAALVLFTSVGISVYEHVCHFTGKVQLSADVPEACCPIKSTSTDNTVFKKAACCDTYVKVIQLNANSFPSFETVHLPSPILAWAALPFLDLISVRLLTPQSLSHQILPSRIFLKYAATPLYLWVANLRL